MLKEEIYTVLHTGKLGKHFRFNVMMYGYCITYYCDSLRVGILIDTPIHDDIFSKNKIRLLSFRDTDDKQYVLEKIKHCLYHR